MGGEGGRRELRGIMIGTHGVCGGHGEDSVAQRRQVLTLWHPAMLMDSDSGGVSGGTQ